MPAAVATNPELQSIRSHWVMLGWIKGQSSKGATSEGLYADVAADWRGRRVVVELVAKRYRDSSGELGPWNVYPQRVNGGPDTDTSRAALRAACAPLVVAWLDSSNGYVYSRQRAYGFSLREELKNESDADRARALIAAHAEMVGVSVLGYLRAMVDALETWLLAGETAAEYLRELGADVIPGR